MYHIQKVDKVTRVDEQERGYRVNKVKVVGAKQNTNMIEKHQPGLCEGRGGEESM